jgi:cytochrome b561
MTEPPRRDTRYTLGAATLLAIALLPALAGYAGFLWELAQFAGLAGCIGCVLLGGAPLRPRAARPPTLLTLRAHTWIGWGVLGAVLLHVAGSLLAEPQVLEYLRPSTPRYQFAGIVALVLLAVLVLGAQSDVRRRWKSHRGFQATHVVLACLMLLLTAVHVAATNRYSGGWAKRALFIGALAGALLLLLRRGRGSPPGAPLARRLVFGRHAWLIAGVTLACVTALAGLYAGAARAAWREPVLPAHRPMPLDFPHAKHVQVNCLTCHHNFADSTGGEQCVGCHQSGRADLKAGAEARFHDFCLECHRHPDAAFERHGPVSGCQGCHRKPS